MGDRPNGLNINSKVGSTHPTALQALVVEQKADLGIAFDGDGDRVILVDDRGEVVDGDQILYVIAMNLLRKGYFNNKQGVAGTLMTNLGLERVLASHKVPFVRTQVGDRYINEELLKRGWRFGGESSGHIICKDVSTTGDGIVAALKVLAAMVETGQSLTALAAGMVRHPQVMVNVPVNRMNAEICEQSDVQAAVASIEERLSGKGRVLLRPSGTEPVVRVMVEGEDRAMVAELAEDLAGTVRHIFSATP